MKRKILLSVLLLSTSLTGFCTIWTVNNSANTFTPATITINFGDTVNFVITTAHDAREVSLTTWNANGNTPLPGGFQTAFGGGMVLPAKLGVGTHYYVCTPHASIGMKGKIIVQNSTGIAENQLQTNISVYPNPFSSSTTLQTDNFLHNATLTVYNSFGQTVKEIKNISGQTVTLFRDNLTSGLYFIRLTQDNKTIAADKLVITD